MTLSVESLTEARAYYVAVHPDGDGGYKADVPEFPGVIAVEDTPVAALESAYIGIALIIAVLREDGDPVPPPKVPVPA